jgi:hypothetical protein
LFTESVNKEIFKGFFILDWQNLSLDIAQSNFGDFHRAKISKSIPFERNWIIEKGAKEKYP